MYPQEPTTTISTSTSSERRRKWEARRVLLASWKEKAGSEQYLLHADPGHRGQHGGFRERWGQERLEEKPSKEEVPEMVFNMVTNINVRSH